MLASTVSAAQTTPPSRNTWSGDVEAYVYLLDSESYLLTIASADRARLHLEARYQYEARDTFSAWIGRPFTTGRPIELELVPIAGAIVGRLDAIGAGLETTITWKSLELYSESEYVFDVGGSEGNFYYNWSNLTWQANNWLTLGPSAQRTRTRGDFSFDFGAFVGVQRRRATLTLYGFDLFRRSRFGILALQVGF